MAPRTARAAQLRRALVSTALIGALLGAVGSVTAGATDATATHTITVQGGQTLWSIAKEAAPNADPRATIAEIKALNQLRGSVVQVGQALVVPAG
jgi:LysM repeat protein